MTNEKLKLLTHELRPGNPKPTVSISLSVPQPAVDILDELSRETPGMTRSMILRKLVQQGVEVEIPKSMTQTELGYALVECGFIPKVAMYNTEGYDKGKTWGCVCDLHRKLYGAGA